MKKPYIEPKQQNQAILVVEKYRRRKKYAKKKEKKYAKRSKKYAKTHRTPWGETEMLCFS